MVRASLKDEFLLSPDAYLKRRREEIRGLEERITYLGGQRDLAVAQEEQQQKTRLELADQLDGLKAEIAALEEKQFAGLDVERMQERLAATLRSSRKPFRSCGRGSSAGRRSSTSRNSHSPWRKPMQESTIWAHGISVRWPLTKHFTPAWSVPPVTAA